MYQDLKNSLPPSSCLVAVSKTKPIEKILDLYAQGHRVFGENKVQELAAKHEALPSDIQWHMIGHLQKNKVKHIAPFVALIHAVDSISLLRKIEREAEKNGRIIPVLLQLRIAQEETKFGLLEEDLRACIEIALEECPHVQISGLMGMASFSEDASLIRKEFRKVKVLFDDLKNSVFNKFDAFSVLSMGMSGDYLIALEEGANMIRIGTLLFGDRN